MTSGIIAWPRGRPASIRTRWARATVSLLAVGSVLLIAVGSGFNLYGSNVATHEWLYGNFSTSVSSLNEGLFARMEDQLANIGSEPAGVGGEEPSLEELVGQRLPKLPRGFSWIAASGSSSASTDAACAGRPTVAAALSAVQGRGFIWCADVPFMVTGFATVGRARVVAAYRLGEAYVDAVRQVTGTEVELWGTGRTIATTFKTQSGGRLPAGFSKAAMSRLAAAGVTEWFGVESAEVPDYAGYLGPANEGAPDAAAFTFERGRSHFDTYMFQGKLGGATGPTLVLIVPVAVMRVGLRYGLIGMSLVGSLILIALTVVTKQVAAALARPLVAIEHAAKSLGAGDDSIRVPEEGDREIASLARSFNQMIEQVSTANAQTIRSEKMAAIGQLAAGIAHEINNPMSYVTSNLCALAADLDTLLANPTLLDDYRREILPETIEGVRRVNAIVADLRRFARGDPEAMIEYDLNDEVRAAARISHCRFGPGRALELHLSALPRLMGHPRQLGQVVVNLLVNAAQAIPGRGTVTVITNQDADAVILTVTDTGTGMSAQTKAKLFQPYFTTKSEADGTGLGLFVAAKIVHEHGGTISVESQLGSGSSFTVRLSRHQTPRVMLVGAASRSPTASRPSLAGGDESAS